MSGREYITESHNLTSTPPSRSRAWLQQIHIHLTNQTVAPPVPGTRYLPDRTVASVTAEREKQLNICPKAYPLHPLNTNITVKGT